MKARVPLSCFVCVMMAALLSPPTSPPIKVLVMSVLAGSMGRWRRMTTKNTPSPSSSSSSTPTPSQTPKRPLVNPWTGQVIRRPGDREEQGIGDENVNRKTGERGGPKGPEPTRFGDWVSRMGRVSDF